MTDYKRTTAEVRILNEPRVFLILHEGRERKEIPIGGDYTSIVFCGDHGDIEISLAVYRPMGHPEAEPVRYVTAHAGRALIIHPQATNQVELVSEDFYGQPHQLIDRAALAALEGSQP